MFNFNDNNIEQPVTSGVQMAAHTHKLYTKITNLEEYVVNNVVKYCSQCGARFKKADVAVLNQEEKLSLVVVTCHRCGYQQAYLISHVYSTAFPANVILDIPYDEIEKYSKMGPITSKEVLHLHKLLKKTKTLKDWLLGPEEKEK